jgi:hypothetical protein
MNRTCIHCGIFCPYEKSDVYHESTGLCDTCYNYQRENGCPRPEHLIEKAKERKAALLNLCDCGKPATHELEVKIGWSMARFERPTKIALLLCDDCFELENEPVIEPAPDYCLRIPITAGEYRVRVV